MNDLAPRLESAADRVEQRLIKAAAKREAELRRAGGGGLRESDGWLMNAEGRVYPGHKPPWWAKKEHAAEVEEWEAERGGEEGPRRGQYQRSHNSKGAYLERRRAKKAAAWEAAGRNDRPRGGR